MINGELVVDNFAGGGGASTGIEMATGVSVDIAINHDPEAIRMHRTNHPTTKHYCEDVWQVDPVKACDGHPVGLAWFSPDCFAKGTLVLTETEYQPIETLRAGDKVLTHNGSWKPITATMMSRKKAVRIVGYGNVGMLCSEDHPFLIKNCPHLWNNQVRQYKRVHNDMQWVRAKDIQGDMYWASRISVDPMPIPQLEKPNTKSVFLPVDERLLWLAGRYVGDGWTRLTDTRAEITIASGMQDVEFLREKLNMWSRKGARCKDGELSWYYRDVRTGGQFTANNRALVKWLRSNFGHLALQKTIPAWLYGAPEPYKEAFMSGYLSADGWTSGNKVECTTISKKLAYGLRTLAVTMGYSPTIYMNHQGDKIEGRTVKTHDIYIVKWKIAIDDKHAQTFTEDGYLWTAVKKVEKTGAVETFYNISVEDDETYIAESIVVHNCKHFSKAKGGKPKDKFIRGLAWVACRWAGLVRPRVIMLENVEEFKTWGPLNRRHHPIKSRSGETFKRFIKQLTDLGYTVEFRELVAADYGAPTMRKRFFLIARCDNKPILWPEPTHAPLDSEAVKKGILKPYVGAYTQLDFSIPCPSIFDTSEEIKKKYGVRAVRPLASKTMQRIARGIQKFVVDNADPFIVEIGYGESKNQKSPRAYSVEKPLHTIVAKDKNFLVAPILTQYHSYENDSIRGQGTSEPIMTIDSSNRYGLVTSFLSKFYKTGIGQDEREPLHTVTTSAGHFGEVRAFLIKYYGNNDGQNIKQPLDTITTHDRFGLVTIKGVDYQIVDIGLRMLEPRELYGCQGFPDDYIIDHDYSGKSYPRSEQVKRCGNAVCPPIPAALVRANLPEMCLRQRMPNMKVREEETGQFKFA